MARLTDEELEKIAEKSFDERQIQAEILITLREILKSIPGDWGWENGSSN